MKTKKAAPTATDTSVTWRKAVRIIEDRFATVEITAPAELLSQLKQIDLTPARSIAHLSASHDGGSSFLEHGRPAAVLWHSSIKRQRFCDAGKRWQGQRTRRIKVEMPEDLYSRVAARAEAVGVTLSEWAVACFDYHVRIEAKPKRKAPKTIRLTIRKEAAHV